MPSTLAPLVGVCYNSASAWSDIYLCLVPYIVLMSKSVSQEYACLHTACFPIWNQRIKAEAPLSVLSPEFERCEKLSASDIHTFSEAHREGREKRLGVEPLTHAHSAFHPCSLGYAFVRVVCGGE